MQSSNSLFLAQESVANIHFSFSPQVARFGLCESLLKDRTSQLVTLLGLDAVQCSVVLLSDQEMAAYNKQYRGKEGPTNVLSFCAAAGESTFPAPPDELGDILISVETAQKEAQEQHHSLHHRLTELIIHGLLHLMGWDHERSEQEAIAMWDKEKELFYQIQSFRRTTMPQLAINVDHVATVRQARGTNEPDPVIAAGICELAGADGIVIHLREDRRHIQDRDVRILRETIKTKMNLEMAIVGEIIDIALDIKPDMITLVPEKRKELTTEGGLDVIGNFKKVKKTVNKMFKAGIPVSLFIDPDAEQIEASVEAGATFVELHTGRYCDAQTEEEQESEFRLIEQAAELAFESGLRVNAGHGLDYITTAAIAAIPTIDELSIGHAVISRAVMVGLDQAVREMCAIVKAPYLSL
ncbi:MAG: pyridoxine 5'-phosphate synthase [Desulfobulbus propionicus]|nr:MAG: pyridoxine 5'-phosphate synthase [Desulfobulbus propionicus]PIE65543.1 MAG: pyridoxine 5'-phosphate synthase [Desulfobacterales bacterium]